jgi:hypothetical protein
MFGTKLVSDSLLAAVKEVTSGVQLDSSGSELSVGDSVKVQEGPHAGRTGTISGFQNTGRSEVQIKHGPSVALYNETLLNENREENLRQREYSRPRKSGNLGSPIEKKGVQAPDPRRSKEGGDSYTRRDPHIGARGVKKVRGAKRPQTSEYIPDHGETFGEDIIFDHLLLDHLLDEAGLDAVDKKALKKKFKNRKDQDIDNDGDEDESDEYLHNRRQTIGKEIEDDEEENGKKKKKGKKNGNGNGNGEKIEINPEIKEAIRKLIQSTLK